MNLRILKKLSKRAAPLLPLLGDNREQFKAEKSESYCSTGIRERKHWERMRTVWKDPEPSTEDRIYYRSRKGHVIAMRMTDHPRKGTIMVGATSGYYEPDWDEETAWDSLRGIVWWSFVEINEDTNHVKPLRRLVTPSDYFKAAAELVAAGAAR